jgi:hypothetical protein
MIGSHWSLILFKRATTAAAFLMVAVIARADPLDKPAVGPKLICFKYSTFSLADGERVTEFSGSPESMSITVEGLRRLHYRRKRDL